MSKCPITYLDTSKGRYSREGLKLLSDKLQDLADFPFTAQEQIALAQDLATKLSIQGVQPKLSAKLQVNRSCFEVVESFGGYIIKPPHHLFEELPQNEDLTMKMACCFGIDTPVHGMIYNKDGSLSYFIKRFDRKKGKNKVPVEDFSQLLGFDRDTKYDASTEKLIAVLDEFTTFPYIEKLQFFRRMLFNFLVGNEDMHLKNYSLIVENGVKRLSPAYDLLNTTIVIKTGEQLALPLNGKKSNLKKHDFLDYLALKRLHLKNDNMSQVLAQLSSLFPKWESLIDRSFLSIERKQNYKQLLRERKSILIS